MFIGYFLFLYLHCSDEFQPKVSIITSVYNADEFIRHFLNDIVKQTIFEQCELLLINAHSPGNEEDVILDFMKTYTNITYVKLGYDPGVYGVWNLGAKIAKGEYLTNANIDDRLAYDCYEIHAKELDNHPEVDLVYSGLYATRYPNKSFDRMWGYEIIPAREFSILAMMMHCLPNDHPMWRKTFHEKYGYFDEKYKSAGDWEMWLRAVLNGAKFKSINKVLGAHYSNPRGLSTGINSKLSYTEQEEIKQKYSIYFRILSEVKNLLARHCIGME